MRFLKLPWVKRSIALAVSASILWILFSRIDSRKVARLIMDSDLRLIILAISISLSVNIFLGAAKWLLILRDLGYKLPFWKVLSVRSGCLPLKVIFPLKSSELLKAFYLKNTEGLPVSRAVSSIILDKTLNVMATLAIFLFGILAADIALPRLFPISALLLITLFLFWPRAQEMVIKLSCRLHPKLRELSASLLSAFSEIGAKKKIYLIAISLAYQMSAIVDVYLIFKAMSTPVPLTAILVFVPLIVMADNVPITTLGLGTREALIIFLFRQYGPASALLGTGVLLSFIEHIIPVLFGLFFMRYFISGFTGNERKVSVKL